MIQLKPSTKTNIGLLLLTTVGLVLPIFGSFIGTYCWYQYRARSYVEYKGTAVGDSGSIQIGLVSRSQLSEFASKHNLSEDTVSVAGSYIYWSLSSGLADSAIKEFEEITGYGSTRIAVTSSGEFNDGDNLSLVSAPSYLKNNVSTPASTCEYSYLPLALRYEGGSYNYFLKSCDLSCAGAIKESVRIGFSNPYDSSNNIIFNPSSLENGKDAVGGILNMDYSNDDMFDFVSGQNYEFIYGKVYDLTYSGETYTGEKKVDPKDVNCFVSNHQKGLLIPNYTPAYSTYYGRNGLMGKKTLTSTDSKTKIALLNATIYVEGWDLKCLDGPVDYEYSLSLEFTYGAKR